MTNQDSGDYQQECNGTGNPTAMQERLVSDVGYVDDQTQVLEDIKGNGESLDAHSTQSGSLHPSPSSPPPLASPVTHEHGQDALCTPQLVWEATVPVCDQRGCRTEGETSLCSIDTSIEPLLVKTKNYDELDSSSRVSLLVNTIWTSAASKNLQSRCIGALDVTMEDETKLYVIACSSNGLKDEVAGGESKFKKVWKQSTEKIQSAVGELKLNVHVEISPVGSSRQCYRGVPGTEKLSMFDRFKQEQYCEEIKMRMKRRRKELMNALGNISNNTLNQKQVSVLRDRLEKSVFGVKFRKDGLPADDFKEVLNFHVRMIENESTIEEMSTMLLTGEERVHYQFELHKEVFIACGYALPYIWTLLRKAIDLHPKNVEEHIRNTKNIPEFLDVNNEIKQQHTGDDLLLQISYSAEMNHSRLADYFAQCAEDNATIALIKWLKENPHKRVKSVDWYSTEWSKEKKKGVHKPLCPICEIRFKDRLEWLIQHTHEVEITTPIEGSAQSEVKAKSTSSHVLLTNEEKNRLETLKIFCALAHVGIGKTTVDVLNLLESYKNKTSFGMWKRHVIPEVRHIGFLLSYTDFHDLFKKYALSLSESIWAKVGLNPDSPSDVLLQTLVLQLRSFYGDQSALTEARMMFEDHLHGRNKIAADLKSAVYSIVAYHGNKTTYEQLKELLNSPTVSRDEKVDIYSALFHMNDEQIITESLSLAFSTFQEKLELRETLAICESLESCLETVIGRDTLWEFVKQNWTMISSYKEVMLGRIVYIATSCFVTVEKGIEIEQFFKDKPCPEAAKQAVKLNCELIRMYAKRLKRDVPLVKEWLYLNVRKALPTDVVPKNYAVELTPDLKAFTFSGKLQIDAEVIRSTSRVVLNSSEITIISASVEVPGTSSPQSAKFSFLVEEETVTFEFPSGLPKGEVTFHVQYTGKLNDQLKGFYRSKYYHPSHPEEERYMAVTQFEPIYARRALPCWDEPAIKSTFDVTMVVPKHLTALSNMNVDSSEEKGDMKRVTFARSPVMSTYLLAFIVGEFNYVEEKDLNGLLVRVYTPLGKGEHGRFALEVAVNAMAIYNTYFNRPYPLPKLDLVAIPDLATEAMENWGLVTCRSEDLLQDCGLNYTRECVLLGNTLEVALVVSQKLAHQWFGNVVTMEWWTYLWLNKSFATWMGYCCLDKRFPKNKIWTHFMTNVYASAMNSGDTHPIEVSVDSSEIKRIFHSMSYCKGASIIHMLHSWIGDEAFRRGINQYLSTFKYKNAHSEDLWKCLEEASEKPVGDVMKTWTGQMGFPVITIEEKQEGNERVVTVSQQKFCADGIIAGFQSVQWMVPITMATPYPRNALTFVLDTKKTTVNIENMGPEDWILVNPGGVGCFRVNYSISSQQKLIVAMENDLLEERDRLAILEDICALAHVGIGRNTRGILILLESYMNETSYAVWKSFIREVRHIDFLLSNTDFHNLFKKYALRLFKSIWTKVEWDPNSSLDVSLRPMLLQQCGFYGDQSVIAGARQQFFHGDYEIAADLKSAVYNIVAYHGDEITYMQRRKLLNRTESSDEKVRIYCALVLMNDEQIITESLKLAFSEEMDPHDTLAICKSCLETDIGRDTLWIFVKNEQTMIRNCKGEVMLGKIIDITTSCFATEEKAVEIDQFFEDNPCPVAERSVKLNCRLIRMHADWLRSEDADHVKSGLERIMVAKNELFKHLRFST